MYFRCTDCRAATWLDRTPPVRDADRVTCGECKREYTVRLAQGLGPSLAEHYRRCVELSNHHRIDMPSAYALLLGTLQSGISCKWFDLARPLPSR